MAYGSIEGQTLQVDLSDYVTISQLNTTLSSYVTQTNLNSQLSGYVTTSALNSQLSSYATQSWVNSQGFAKTSQIPSIPAGFGNRQTYDSSDVSITASTNQGYLICIEEGLGPVTMINTSQISGGGTYILGVEYALSAGSSSGLQRLTLNVNFSPSTLRIYFNRRVAFSLIRLF